MMCSAPKLSIEGMEIPRSSDKRERQLGSRRATLSSLRVTAGAEEDDDEEGAGGSADPAGRFLGILRIEARG